MAIWKNIKGFEGIYWVSDEGQVISLGNDKTRKTKILKPAKNNIGYLYIFLCKDGKKKKYLVHQLVAQAFIPNPDNLPECNHISEIKTDNRVENLEWCGRKYNCNYGTRNQRVAEKNTNGKCSKPVLQYDLEGNFIKEYPSLSEVKRQLGFNQAGVSYCCTRKIKTAYGYIWKYKEEEKAA